MKKSTQYVILSGIFLIAANTSPYTPLATGCYTAAVVWWIISIIFCFVEEK
jgi:hypothetical protein